MPTGASHPMPPISRSEWALVAALSAALVAFTQLPVVLAYAAGDRVFTGILINPADGLSYLAKMRQGLAGNWLATLPYTADPGAGAFMYTYYLFLGHLARWLGTSVEVVYHTARIAGGMAMLLAFYPFAAAFLASPRARMAAWLVFSLGSGLGWLGVAFGIFTADLWVAEAFPFLALMSNAHFPLAIAILVWLIRLAAQDETLRALILWRVLGTAVLTPVLAQVQPIALIVAILIAPAIVAVRVWRRRRFELSGIAPALTLVVLAVPWLAYFGVILPLTHPVLAGWSAQNLTPSPPLWDWLLAGGVPFALALLGAVAAVRRGAPGRTFLATWLVLGALALYAPFALQRRLSIGLWAPVAVLAIMALRLLIWPRIAPRWRPMLAAGLAVLMLPSTFLLYAAGAGAVAQRDPAIFLSHDEAAAIAWLGQNAGPGAIVVASPEIALVVPARTDVRVIYGHPFETADAEQQLEAVLAFLEGRRDRAHFVSEFGVDYVFLGPRERELGAEPPDPAWDVVFNQGSVSLYAP